MSGERTSARAAGWIEVWAARAWNVFNEGRPFGVVYPPLAVAGAALVGAAPGPAPAWGLLAGLGLSLVWARFAFPLRARALLWLLLVPSVILLESWRARGLIAVGLGGWLLFTVGVWGTVYYHLRTGAPWTNFLRFWRLVATNSDPTSGNALEQVPKLVLTLSAIAAVAREPGAAAALEVGLVAAAGAALGALARQRHSAARLPRYPEARARPAGPALARRVHVIVIDGCNRERLRQASALGLTPVLDRLAREGTEYLDVQTAYPARTVVCFSSMLTGAPPEEHGMRSNFAPRLGVRVPSLFDVLAAHGRRGRLVGIAHLLDPFGEEHVRSVTSVQPTGQLDFSLAEAARDVSDRDDPDLLVAQLLAADQLGHVRGTRNAEYLHQLAETDRRIGELLEFLGERGRLRDAAVIVMADHGQGRGIGGHGHLDWGETPVPFIVWGAGAVPGAACERPCSILELAATVARLLGVPAPAAARGRALVPVEDPDVRPARPAPDARAVALLVAEGGGAPAEALLASIPPDVEGVPLDRVVIAPAGARVPVPSGVRVVRAAAPAGALEAALGFARAQGYAAAVHLPADGAYPAEAAVRALRPVLSRRAGHVVGSRFIAAENATAAARRPLAHALLGASMGSLLGGLVLTDPTTRCRALGRDALERAALEPGDPSGATATVRLALEAGIVPLEIPVPAGDRTLGEGLLAALTRQWRAASSARRGRRHARHSRMPSTARATTSAAVTPSAHGDGTP